MSKAEQQYAQIEKECLAIVFACEHFDQYIFGCDIVTIHTDHKPLESIFKKSLLNAPKRLQRMLLRLQKYNLNVQYLKGAHMYIADMLSRASLPSVQSSCEDRAHVFRVELENIDFCESLKVSEPRLQQIRKFTEHDETLQALKSIVLLGWPDLKSETPISVRDYWNYRDEIVVQNGILFKANKVIIPKLLRPEMLTRIHSSHLGTESCIRKARDTLYWPNMQGEIKDFISQCSTCNEFERNQEKETLINHKIPDRPWSKIGIVLFTFKKEEYLIAVDYYSDYFEIDKLHDTTSSSIIECLKIQFSRHGIPDTVVSDNGAQLVSSEFHDFAQDWEFEHVTSSPYHSQSNGKAESAVKIAKNILKKSKRSGKDQWKALLDWGNTPNVDMNSSPVQRLMSRRTRHTLPISNSLLTPKVIDEVADKLFDKRKKAKLY